MSRKGLQEPESSCLVCKHLSGENGESVLERQFLVTRYRRSPRTPSKLLGVVFYSGSEFSLPNIDLDTIVRNWNEVLLADRPYCSNTSIDVVLLLLTIARHRENGIESFYSSKDGANGFISDKGKEIMEALRLQAQKEALRIHQATPLIIYMGSRQPLVALIHDHIAPAKERVIFNFFSELACLGQINDEMKMLVEQVISPCIESCHQQTIDKFHTCPFPPVQKKV